MIRLTQICLMVFLATLAAYVYQLIEHRDYTLSFLVMGAAGCLYLLLRMERHYTQINLRKAQSARPANYPPKRIAPKLAAAMPIVERKAIPVVSRAHERQR
jgi:hypothetical protein